jgi:hypothetical protein
VRRCPCGSRSGGSGPRSFRSDRRRR